MASVIQDPNGRKRIQFMAADGRRKTVRLGRASRRDAEQICRHIEGLVASSISGQPVSRETAVWVGGIGSKLHDRLARAGLVEGRLAGRTPLASFLADLFATFAGKLKPNTLLNYQRARDCLLEHFAGRTVQSITAKDADAYAAWLRGRLSAATAAKRIIVARQFFKQAVRWRLIQSNPFADVRAGSQANKAREHFVSREDVAKLLAAAPNAQWRAMIALSRFGGLRCPSEVLALRWSDVDFGNGRLRVPSCKTEHHAGRAERIIPLFPEVESALLELYNPEDVGDGFIITSYRDTRSNLRTQLCRIIKRAGLEVWQRPWHNMRATRQTELAERYPLHVVCQWMGNSSAIAAKHYLQVTDEHFATAIAQDAVPAGQGGWDGAVKHGKRVYMEIGEAVKDGELWQGLEIGARP